MYTAQTTIVMKHFYHKNIGFYFTSVNSLILLASKA